MIIQDENSGPFPGGASAITPLRGRPRDSRYNFWMRFCRVACAILLLYWSASAQEKSASAPQFVTVPLTIDHNRVVIEVSVLLSNGATQRVRAWVDNGTPDLYISRHLATSMDCNGQICLGAPPVEMTIGGMTIPLGGRVPGAGIKEAKIPLRSGDATSVIAPGMNAEINIPSTVLRRYDVLIDFPDRRFSIGAPGTIHFRGPSGKVQIDAENGLIQVPSQIEKKKYTFALDLGASISFLSVEVFDKLAAAHPDWPQMTGAVGPVNMWGTDEETKWRVMRIDRLQYGPLFLTDVAVAALPTNYVDFLEKPTGESQVGILGSSALLNYRVGIDYAHSTVYFEFGRMFSFPDFDVIGLTLRPEDDGRFTILGVADFEGKPSLPAGPDGVQAGDHLVAVDNIPVGGSTLGQVWNMLGGTPGQERRLTIEHGGRQFTVAAKVQHFLGELPDEDEKERKKKK